MRKLFAALLVWLAFATPALAAIGTPTSLGSNTVISSNTSSTLAITTTANIATGDLVIIVSSSASTGVIATGATDSGGVNTYTCPVSNSNAPTISLCYTFNATALSSGGTITTSGWTTTAAAKATAAFTISGMLATDPLAPKNQGSGTTGTSTSAAAVNMGPLYAQPALMVGMLVGNSNMGTITNAGMTQIVVSGTANGEQVAIWYKTTTSGFVLDSTWAPSWANSKLFRTAGRWFIGASPTYAPSSGGMLGVVP